MNARAGLSWPGILLTTAALALLFLLVLRVVSDSTRIDPGPGAGDPEPALESASRALQGILGAAGNGLPPATESLRVLCRNAPCADAPRDESGAIPPLARGSDVLLVRGVLLTPLFALDPFDRGTGVPWSGPLGSFRATPRRARLDVPVYPLSFNPARIWVLPPEGLGRAFGPEGEPGRPNEPLQPVVEALRVAGASGRLFVISDGEERAAVARVAGADPSALQRGCRCDAPAAKPGDCPPGRVGCRLELTLDFEDAEARAALPGEGPEALERLGAPVAGGLLDEIVFAVLAPATEAGSEVRPWLAMGTGRGHGRYAFSRVAEGIEALRVTREAARVAVMLEARTAQSARRSTFAVPLPLSAGGEAP